MKPSTHKRKQGKALHRKKTLKLLMKRKYENIVLKFKVILEDIETREDADESVVEENAAEILRWYRQKYREEIKEHLQRVVTKIPVRYFHLENDIFVVEYTRLKKTSNSFNDDEHRLMSPSDDDTIRIGEIDYAPYGITLDENNNNNNNNNHNNNNNLNNHNGLF